MPLIFPSNCNNEGSRWSFTIKLGEVLRLYHNANCEGMTAGQAVSWRKSNFLPKMSVLNQAKLEQVAIAKVGAHWNPKIPDHVNNGVINYPPSLDMNNEGSRGSFLFGLAHKLADKILDDPDVVAVSVALTQAKQDAIDGNTWLPTLGDIT